MTQRQIRIALGIIVFFLLVLLGVLFTLTRTGRQAQTGISRLFHTATPTATIPPPPTATALPSPVPTATAAETPTVPPPAYPEAYYIMDITGHRQFYTLACEASAAVDWAHYFGVDFHEYTFQVGMPISDNPDYGFVGDFNSAWGQIPPYGYGVYSGPVADELVNYGLPAKGVKGYSLDELKQKVSEQKPVIVWVIGNMVWSEPVNYTDAEGRTTVVAPYEHVVIVTGYNSDTIRYMTNGKFYEVPTKVFLRSWGVLGNMAVVYDDSLEPTK